MSLPSPLPLQASLVATLRAAGCVFAEDEAELLRAAARTPAELEALVGRRVSGEPLEQVLGWAEFCGLRIGIAPGVFVPRRRTEALAAAAIERTRPGAVVVDLCCGSGAVGAAVDAAVPGIELHAADVDPAAVSCARNNLPRGHVYAGDLFGALPADLRGRVDVLACNAPYVPTAAIPLMPPEARDHEPAVALDGGDDGLVVLRQVIAGAPSWLATGGSVLFETGTAQIPAATAAVRAAGLEPLVLEDDELGSTVVVGQKRSRSA
jgi:release factor glutamine methyltransferase